MPSASHALEASPPFSPFQNPLWQPMMVIFLPAMFQHWFQRRGGHLLHTRATVWTHLKTDKTSNGGVNWCQSHWREEIGLTGCRAPGNQSTERGGEGWIGQDTLTQPFREAVSQPFTFGSHLTRQATTARLPKVGTWMFDWPPGIRTQADWCCSEGLHCLCFQTLHSA